MKHNNNLLKFFINFIIFKSFFNVLLFINVLYN